jgi:cobalt-precorrin 5A hydrolase
VTYEPEELKQLSGSFTESEFVEQTTGVDNVCERSAVMAAENADSGLGLDDSKDVVTELICRKTVYDGVTVALARRKGRVVF